MLKERVKRYVEKTPSNTLSLFFSGHAPKKSADQTYEFSVNRNFYYLTGIEQQNVCLAVLKGEKEFETFLFLEKQDPLKALWDGATLSFEEASTISDINLKNIRDINSLKSFIGSNLMVSRASKFGLIETIYLDLELQSFEKVSFVHDFARKLKHHHPNLSIKSSELIMSQIRMVKDELEIENLKKAIDIANLGLNGILESLKPGMYEYEIEAIYNYILNINKSSPSFNTIAASGKNATILHYIDNNSKIGENDLILFDLGALYNNYASDISRTYPASGKFSDRQKQIYEIVLKANKETIKWVKAGVTIEEFNNYGKQILIDGLKEIGLIKNDEEITKYYYHSLGHYLGLDVHDKGDYNKVIPEGAILTVEPGLYIAEENIGIRIEDDILITKDGCINLSKDIIKEIKDIEKAMKK